MLLSDLSVGDKVTIDGSNATVVFVKPIHSVKTYQGRALIQWEDNERGWDGCNTDHLVPKEAPHIASLRGLYWCPLHLIKEADDKDYFDIDEGGVI